VHLSLLCVSLLFGANYVFTKEVLAALPASAWVFFRIAAATTLLVPLALVRGRGWPPLRLLAGLVLASFLGVVLNQVLFTEGLALTTSAHSAVINACIPTWTLCLAALFGQERLTAQKVAAVLIALCGVATLLRVDELLGGAQTISGDQVLGDLLTWANGVSFALHLVLMRRIGRGVHPWVSVAVMFSAATAMVGFWALPGVSADHVQAVVSPPTVWFAVYGVLFATVLTYSLNTWALQHARGSQVALYINVQPLVAAALAPAFGQPAPDWRFFVALAGVSCGLVLQTRTG
jgi:drug/metabolite transporter (DMT)-like permease